MRSKKLPQRHRIYNQNRICVIYLPYGSIYILYINLLQESAQEYKQTLIYILFDH